MNFGLSFFQLINQECNNNTSRPIFTPRIANCLTIPSVRFETLFQHALSYAYFEAAGKMWKVKNSSIKLAYYTLALAYRTSVRPIDPSNIGEISAQISHVPAKILLPFLCTAPLQYVPKMLFTRPTIDYLVSNKTKNPFHNEAVILNYIGGDPISRTVAWVINHL